MQKTGIKQGMQKVKKREMWIEKEILEVYFKLSQAGVTACTE